MNEVVYIRITLQRIRRRTSKGGTVHRFLLPIIESLRPTSKTSSIRIDWELTKLPQQQQVLILRRQIRGKLARHRRRLIVVVQIHKPRHGPDRWCLNFFFFSVEPGVSAGRKNDAAAGQGKHNGQLLYASWPQDLISAQAR